MFILASRLFKNIEVLVVIRVSSASLVLVYDSQDEIATGFEECLAFPQE